MRITDLMDSSENGIVSYIFYQSIADKNIDILEVVNWANLNLIQISFVILCPLKFCPAMLLLLIFYSMEM